MSGAGPRCLFCHDAIRPGQEADKRAEYWELDGKVRIYGHQMPDGKLSDAEGMLVGMAHSKHYWADRRRAERAAKATPDAESRNQPAEEDGQDVGH